MKRLANFPLVLSILLIILLMVSPLSAAELINVTGNGVELTDINVNCANENEIGISVSGTDFVGLNIFMNNCIAGGFAFNESATLTNSLAFSVGNDITIAVGKTVIGIYNLFGDSVHAGEGVYSDDENTTKWSASQFVKPSVGLFQKSVPQYYHTVP